MSFSFLALMVGILSGIMLLVVIFSLLTLAKRADAQAEKWFGMGREEGQWEDSQTMVEQVETNQKPVDEVVGILRMSRPELPH
jgi:hypothetical protein